jgi:phosphatidylserine/phosphatidylglycerophosphate/cardiolipin synthase-like enzyme
VTLSDGTVVETRLTTFDRMEELPIKIIKDAKKSVKFLAFSFTHKKIAAAMKERAKAGVPVIGVFEQRNLKVSEYADFLDEPNITVLPDGNSFNMHHKVIIVDDAVVLAGSFNFTQSACGSNDENYVVISRNPTVAKQFVAEFEQVYKAASVKLAQREAGSRR